MRIEQLKLMHELLMTCNDEELLGTWFALCVPDQPDEDDFKWIAESNEDFETCVRVFKKIVNNENFYI